MYAPPRRKPNSRPSDAHAVRRGSVKGRSRDRPFLRRYTDYPSWPARNNMLMLAIGTALLGLVIAVGVCIA